MVGRVVGVHLVGMVIDGGARRIASIRRCVPLVVGIVRVALVGMVGSVLATPTPASSLAVLGHSI